MVISSLTPLPSQMSSTSRGDAAGLVVLHHRGAGREQALRVAVALRGRQVADDVDQDLLGRLEAERGRVADVQLDDPAALVLEPLGLLQYRPADVVADVGELLRLASSTRHQRSPHRRRSSGAPGCPAAERRRTTWQV